MRIFVLEDDTYRLTQFREALIGAEVVLVKTCADALVQYRPPYDILCLDHDLGDRVHVNSADEETGAEFVRQLPVDPSPSPLVIVHSYNPIGAMEMIRLLHSRGYRAQYVPFGPKLLTELQALIVKGF